MTQRDLADASPHSLVAVNYHKYDGTQHWQHTARLLGVDEYAVWVGACRGERVHRPGREFHWSAPWVVGFSHDQYYSLNVNAEHPKVPTKYYSDMASPATWHRVDDGFEVRTIDLDLDVVVTVDGTLLVDDEDEFAEHQVTMSYPDEVVAAVRQACDTVYRGFEDSAEPFASVGEAWLKRWLDDEPRFSPVC